MNTPTWMLLVAALAAPAAGQNPVPAATDLLEEQPELLRAPQLLYPKALRRAGIEGRVVVQFMLDTSGRAEPQSVTVVETPDSGFDRSAMDFVLAARFRPARVAGRAVRVAMRLPIEFKINAPTDDLAADSAAGDTVYRPEDVDEQAEMTYGPRPDYPENLRVAGVQGRVLIQCIIDTTGRVEPRSVKVIQSPHPALTRSVIDQLLKSRFRPARVHGRAVRVLATMPFDFHLGH